MVHVSRPTFTAMAVVVAVVLYGVFLSTQIEANAGAADSSGYLNQARLLRAGLIRTPTRALPGLPAKNLSAFAYIPLGFSPAEAGDPTDMVPIYPIGLPLLIVATSWFCGWEAAPHMTMLIHAAAGVALLYAAARRCGASTPAAWLGALVLAISPNYIFSGSTLFSDVPALVWTTATVLLAWRSPQNFRYALAAGAALGMAVLVRPTNLLAMLPVGIGLGLQPRRWLALVLGGLPSALALQLYNHAAYGHVWQTGYGPIWETFEFQYAATTLIHYMRWLPVTLTPLIAVAVGLPWVTDAPRRTVALLTSWWAAFGGFYLFYPFTHQAWWYLRFLLPAFPPLIISALLVADNLAGRWLVWLRRDRIRPAIFGLAGVLVGWAAPANYSLHSLNAGNNERVYVEATAWARVHLPANAIIVAMQTTGAVYYYTDFVLVNWAFVTATDISKIQEAAAGRPMFAMLFPYEHEKFPYANFSGIWKVEKAIRHVTFLRHVRVHAGSAAQAKP